MIRLKYFRLLYFIFHVCGTVMSYLQQLEYNQNKLKNKSQATPYAYSIEWTLRSMVISLMCACKYITATP